MQKIKKHQVNKKIRRLGTVVGCIMVLALLMPAPAFSIRLKDMADLKGVRENQLVGYGLVVGLDGTGDNKAPFTEQSMVSMLEKMGISVEQNDIAVKNVAAVMITAILPPFAKAGSKIDVLVSSIGDASNLQGGTLLFTPLKAADGNVYAVAQGPVSTGGFSAEGAGGSVSKNFPTVGRIVDGATIEKEIITHFNEKQELIIHLHHPDFTTASRITEAINTTLNGSLAQSRDAGTILLNIPQQYHGRVVDFVTLIEKIDVTPDITSKVVVNERTGTVVMGENVRISTVAIAHGNLSIEIKESAAVSQPEPFSRGETVAVPETDIAVSEGKSPIYLMDSGASLNEVIRALNALGVTPRDLIAIMQALKMSGALQAKLEIM